jgi:hypothetical protein
MSLTTLAKQWDGTGSVVVLSRRGYTPYLQRHMYYTRRETKRTKEVVCMTKLVPQQPRDGFPYPVTAGESKKETRNDKQVPSEDGRMVGWYSPSFLKLRSNIMTG